MAKGILGKKLGMTQIFTQDGLMVPVTVIEAGPCPVVQKKTEETDGYNAIQIGFLEKAAHKVPKPLQGHFGKASVKTQRYLREIRANEASEIADVNVGDSISADVFSDGELVDITGISKGKGFAGVIKRYNFSRGPMSHGSHYHRGVGSLGATDPARVFKGRKLPGRMGGQRVTVQNIQVVKVDAARNLLLVRGAVPGPKGSMVMVRQAVKSKQGA